jgi:lipopolysaccharide transport system ATP-binding protein
VRAAVVLNEVSKVFRSVQRYRAGLKTLLLNPGLLARGHEPGEFRALDRVTLTVYAGETFGIIGRNGAGKSTLLGLMGGILTPSSGSVTIEGRVAPLLELGVGFTHELSGRENILLNGVLLGMRRREVEARLDEIIAFSGLTPFIGQPLKTYSSGMQMRLGFSIAVHSRPDVLLVDEVLAVGDAEFQKKCLTRIAALREQGVTIVFVSHDLRTVEAVCHRVAYLERGRLAAVGTAPEVIAEYLRAIGDGASTAASAAGALSLSGQQER